MRKLMLVSMMVLSGCATTWHKAGVTREQASDDKLKCTAQARMDCGGDCYRWVFDRSMRECMEDRGYSVQKD